MVPRLLHPLVEQGGPGEPAGRGHISSSAAAPGSSLRLLPVLFLAGQRTGHLLLPLSSSDSRLGNASQVLLNVILLLAGGTAPVPCPLSGVASSAQASWASPRQKSWPHFAFSRCIYTEVSALMALFAS